MPAIDLDEMLIRLSGLPAETEWVEFKVNNADPRKIGEYCSALANSALLADKNSGYLVFGVENEGHNLMGTNVTLQNLKQGNEDFQNWLHNRLEPQIHIEFFEHEFDSKNFLILKINPTYLSPVSFNKEAYIRVGSSVRNLNSEQQKAQALWQKCSAATFEQSIARQGLSAEETISLLDIESYYRQLDIPYEKDEALVIDRLLEEKMIQQEIDGTYSIKNLGAILLAKKLSEFPSVARRSVRIIKYEGKGRIHANDDREGNLGYVSGFAGMLAYINRSLPSREVIEGATREIVYQYPVVALREFIANAIIHQDFSVKGSGPLVEIFSDRVEISNPGKPLMDVMRLMDNPPISRNESLARFMRRCNLCEERGSGIDRAVFLIEKAELPAPSFHVTDTHMRVTLWGPKAFADLTIEERQWACYWHCCLCHLEGNIMTNGSIRERLGISKRNYPQASQVISDTKARGWIKDFDPDNKAPRYAKYVPFWA